METANQTGADHWEILTLDILAEPTADLRRVRLEEFAAGDPKIAAALHACVTDMEQKITAGTLTPDQLERLDRYRSIRQ